MTHRDRIEKEVAEYADGFVDAVFSEEARASVEEVQEEVEQGIKEAREAVLNNVDDKYFGVYDECQ